MAKDEQPAIVATSGRPRQQRFGLRAPAYEAVVIAVHSTLVTETTSM
jgi:hypothetical protein